MTIASRSSVLASPPNSLAASWAARPGRYADGIPAARARESASAPMLRTWSTTTRTGELGEKRVEGVFPVGYGLAREHLAVARRDARPVRRLPDVEVPMTISGLLGGAMVVSSNRQADRKPSLRHPHYLAVAPAPGSFLSVVRSGERLRWQHPRGLFGAGADGHPEAPDRRPLGACPYRRQCAECSPPKFIDGVSQTVMGIPDSDREVIDKILDLDEAVNHYNPITFDKTKYYYRNSETTEELIDYFIIWARQGADDPLCYLSAVAHLQYPWIYPSQTMDYYNIDYEALKEICRFAQCRLHTWKSAYRQGLSKLPSPSLTRRTSEHDFGLPSQTGKYSRLQLLVEHCALCNVDTANLEFHSPRDTQAQDKSRSPRAHVCIHGRSLYFTAGDVPLCAPSVRPHTACFRHRIKRDEARRDSRGAKRPMREE